MNRTSAWHGREDTCGTRPVFKSLSSHAMNEPSGNERLAGRRMLVVMATALRHASSDTSLDCEASSSSPRQPDAEHRLAGRRDKLCLSAECLSVSPQHRGDVSPVSGTGSDCLTDPGLVSAGGAGGGGDFLDPSQLPRDRSRGRQACAHSGDSAVDVSADCEREGATGSTFGTSPSLEEDPWNAAACRVSLEGAASRVSAAMSGHESQCGGITSETAEFGATATVAVPMNPASAMCFPATDSLATDVFATDDARTELSEGKPARRILGARPAPRADFAAATVLPSGSLSRHSISLPVSSPATPVSPHPLAGIFAVHRVATFPSVVISDHSTADDGAASANSTGSSGSFSFNLHSPEGSFYRENPAMERKLSTGSTCSDTSSISCFSGASSLEEAEERSSSRRKKKVSGWRKIRNMVQWSPFIQYYKKQKYPWVQLAGHQGKVAARSCDPSCYPRRYMCKPPGAAKAQVPADKMRRPG
ncbi:PREDICTED: uncharacterized protein LOC106809796 [Priapulus caudatus]|uniref:Uncharacterized protein LOC106809796 n=1 Tax=Priapulus caudatus TaxID=37621 RepID=A0ABM1E8G5_PRICU|nr:PREDICTED: uncharacterized protein LOC106809796 [Priapulus caudatus]